ncbi:hypothetical protein, partial [Salmonella enterica]|uniref:hypothetical protein n=1 Tax=Salmonella enterica TaxID=28901 RepID=UPI001E2A88B3
FVSKFADNQLIRVFNVRFFIDGKARNTQPAALEKPIEYQADKVMTFAIRSLTERQSVITERELMDVAMKHGYGRLTLDDIRAARERA